MTRPTADTPIYTDLNSLTSLKRGAAAKDPTAIRKVAEQFESMFTRMMLKSMRDAVGKDPVFGSDQQKMYQDMADDQLSVQLSRGKGLGLADMLIKQLKKMGVPGAEAALGHRHPASPTAVSGSQATAGSTSGSDLRVSATGLTGAAGNSLGQTGHSGAGTRAVGLAGLTGLDPTDARQAGSATPGPDLPTAGIAPAARAGSASTDAPAASAPTVGSAGSAALGAAAYATTQHTAPSGVAAMKADFISRMWPHAEAAAQQLGTDPRHLIAQAALETNWGRSLPHDHHGQSSHNLFGIKAGPDWNGSAIAARTREFLHGAAGATTAAFRAYTGPAQSFQDYVSLLRGSSRYAGALNTGSNTHAFASALQRAGYATDPDYVHKLKAIVHGIHAPQASSTLMAAVPGAQGLKFASVLPITPTTGAL